MTQGNSGYKRQEGESFPPRLAVSALIRKLEEGYEIALCCLIRMTPKPESENGGGQSHSFETDSITLVGTTFPIEILLENMELLKRTLAEHVQEVETNGQTD